ncbi:hypothetical protein HYU13_05990 [Candidatus Woesearchaeota archaeon]|nr:hypothetical protein [Candidatus Woesearchaeota archaeon]
MQLSKLESQADEALKKNNLAIFTAKDLMLLLGINRMKAYNLAKALKRKGSVNAVKGGMFALAGTNELSLGPHLNWPSYLSFWSALNYYGFSDQMPRTLFYASVKYMKKRANCQFVTLSNKRFFGYTSIGSIAIAEKEKAFADSLLFPKYAGGMNEIGRCLKNALKDIDIEKMIGYAEKLGNKAVLRRLGFLLEIIGIGGSLLAGLKKGIGRGYERIDPSLPKRNHFNKEWLLDINDDIAH